MMIKRLSVVIPTFNEVKHDFLPRILRSLAEFRGELEVLVVDRQSTDGTPALAKDLGAQLLSTSANARGARLNLGFLAASAQVILLHHPRTLIDPQGIEHLLRQGQDLTWGGFRHKFDLDHPILRFTSWYSNHVRLKLKGIVYLDHCIFLNRTKLPTLQSIPEVEIFEDTLLSLDLLKTSKPTLLPFDATTSPIRFRTNGFARQVALNQILKMAFWLGVSPKTMNALYEKRLGLNSKLNRSS